VSAPGHLNVQHGVMTLPNSCASDNLSAVQTSETFVLSSQQLANTPGSDPAFHHAVCGLNGSTSVECCRRLIDSATLEVGYQVVEVSGAEVQRGEFNLGSILGTVGISAVDLTWAMPLISTNGMIGASSAVNEIADEDEHATFAALELENGTQLEIARGKNPFEDTTVWWQVIEWPH
jgi:hypothetical protein